MNLRLALIALSVCVPAIGADYDLQFTPQSSKVNWTLGDVLHTVHGTFKLKRGDIRFDPDTGKASGDVIVDATSGNSGSSARDSRMHKNVLESGKFPEVLFSPDHVEGKVALAGASNVRLHGLFTIHGAAHEITVPVQE